MSQSEHLFFFFFFSFTLQEKAQSVLTVPVHREYGNTEKRLRLYNIFW